MAAYRFELGKCDHVHVREQQIEQLNHIDYELALAVAEGVGVKVPTDPGTPNHGRSSPALSQANTVFDSPRTRKVAILVAEGVDPSATALAEALRQREMVPELLAATGGVVHSADGADVAVDRAINTMASVLYDAVVVPGGESSVAALSRDGAAVHFVAEAIKHAKPVGALGAGRQLVERAANGTAQLTKGEDGAVHSDHGVISVATTDGTVPQEFLDAFHTALARHRPTAAVPA